MQVLRIAAFADGAIGGNPAGVVLVDRLPHARTMQAVAAEIGASETVFAEPDRSGWRVKYFSPEIEVPFCGHATIALGGALAMTRGDAVYRLRLGNTEITVEGRRDGRAFVAAFQSPPTW